MKVVIWGAGNTGAMVAYIFSYDRDIQVAAVLDDDPALEGRTRHGVPVLRPEDRRLKSLRAEGVEAAIVAIGDGRLRERFSQVLEQNGFRIINAIHPDSSISPHVKLGTGVIVSSGVTLYYNPVIGNNVFIGPGVTVTHDTVIEENVELAIGCTIGARVRVGKNAFVGVGATVAARDDGHLTIGENAIVGIGAAVIDDVPPNAVVVGVPARVVRYRNEGGRL